jgi:prevent-host-death family protein
MARQVNIHEAKTHFSELIAAVERGEEIIIARRGKPVARLNGADSASETKKHKPKFGLWKGKIKVHPSFYDPMTEEELEEWYAPLERSRGTFTSFSHPAAAATRVTVLLDTNAFLLFALGSRRLSSRVRTLIETQEEKLVVSAVTPWELATKSMIGRLQLPAPVDVIYRTTLETMQATELAITAGHALRVAALPRIHADPFDRLLVAQSLIEGIAIATNDRLMGAYGIQVVW